MESQPAGYTKPALRQNMMYCKAGKANPSTCTCQVGMRGVVRARCPSVVELVQTITEGGREKNGITAPLSSDGPNLPNVKGVILGINLFTGF